MTIKHCIIHGISLSQQENKVRLALREDENPSEGSIISLFTQLKHSLQRSATRQYGLFDPEQSDNPLPSWLKKLEQQELGFVSTTQKIMQQLEVVIQESVSEETELDFASHLLFVVEELMDHQYLYVFWINHTDAQYIDSQLNTEELCYINSSKLHYVLKLDYSQWSIKDWQQYLTVQVSRGNNELAHIFNKLSGFVSGVNLQKQTDEFLEIVEQYTQSLDKQESNPTKNTIVNYCVDQDMQGNPINFESLSQVLDEQQPDKFSNFVNQNQDNPKKEIYAHRNSLKKYVRFYGREKDLSISFSSDRMDENISYNPETGSLTFKQVPKSLQAQLAKYLKKQE